MLQSLPKPAKVLLRRLYFTVFRGAPAPDRLLYAIDEPRGQRPLRAIRGRCVLRGWAVTKDHIDPPRVRVRVNRALYPVRVMARGDVREALYRSPPYAEDCGFELALQLNRGAHLIRIEVELRPAVWRALSNTLFLSLGLRQAPGRRVEYAAWARLAEAWRPLERQQFEAHLPLMAMRPHFEVFIRSVANGDPQATRASLARQIYPDFSIYDLSDGEAPPPARDLTGYRVFLCAGDQLADDALYAFADLINADGTVDVLYGDEDLIDPDGALLSPFFKPGWSPTYLAGANYLGRAAAFSNRLDHCDLADRALLSQGIGADPSRVASIPRVLLHRPVSDAAGLLADAGCGEAGAPATRADVFDAARVLLVVRAKDERGAAWLAPTTYPHLKIVKDVRARGIAVGTSPQPAWLEGAAGQYEVLVFVDEDMTPCSPSWIEALVAPLSDPIVGVVGPTLVDRASGLRHIGMTNNDGEPAPIQVEPDSATVRTPRNVLGVSRACLATRLDDFIEVGGFMNGLGSDLEGLDYCLKLADRGRLAVHAPGAELTMARWRASRPEAITWHQQAWPRACVRDPYYREDALATRPATHVVAMKVINP
jgi:GT2 family glycosyltransferase